MKIPRTRKQKRPRNTAARALRSPLFRPRVVRNPKAYKRPTKRTEPEPEGE
jgi:hypothetical protein